MNGRYKKIDLRPESLTGIQVLRELNPAQRQGVLRLCEGRKYPKSWEIVSFHETRRDVFFVVCGRVSASICSPSGRHITFQVLGPGQMFGELAAIDEGARSTNVVAVEDTVVIRISDRSFHELLATYPSVAQATMKRLTATTRFLCERIYEFHEFAV